MSKGSTGNWSDLRIFLGVGRSGSTLGAAKALGRNHTTVARRIEVLEHDLGLTLFERDTRGFRLTEDGLALMRAAEAVEAAVGELDDEAARLRRTERGVIRITAPGPILDLIMVPVIAAFSAEHPQVRFEYLASLTNADMQAGEADVALRFGETVEGDDVVCRRLPNFPWSVYCSKQYAKEHSVPSSMGEVPDHPVVGFMPPVATNRAYRWFAKQIPDECIVARCDNHPNMRAILASGAGVGPLSCGLAAEWTELMPCFEPPKEMYSRSGCLPRRRPTSGRLSASSSTSPFPGFQPRSGSTTYGTAKDVHNASVHRICCTEGRDRRSSVMRKLAGDVGADADIGLALRSA